MVVSQGGLIEVADYNVLALEINRLFSDNAAPKTLASDIILNDVAAPAGEPGGATRNLSPNPLSTDYLVVTVDGLSWTTDRYSVNYGTGVITFIDPLDPDAVLVVYNRTTHRYGWGQTASVYPITAGNPILADESVLQAYLEANVNNIIDKVNVIEERIGGPSALTRISLGNLILAQDKSTITQAIDNDILTSDNYWQNTVSTVTTGAQTFTRSTDWDNQLIGVMRYTWDGYDELRHFLNSGCECRAFVTMTGDPLNQGYNNWNQVVTSMGSLILKYDTATQTGSGGVSSNLGIYDLTTTYQTVFTSGSPSTPVDDLGDYAAYGTFSNLVMVWAARLQEDVEGAGTISLDIQLTMNDQALNTTTSGTTTFSGGYKMADDVTDNSAVFSVASATPTLTVFEDFVSGNDS